MRSGDLCLIDDDFFEKVCDANLKINYGESKRPHIVAFKEKDKDLYWVIPCSSKVEKFRKILNNKLRSEKDGNGIMILKINELKDLSALLFQDMFPVTKKYMIPYMMHGIAVNIASEAKINIVRSRAYYCHHRLQEGFRFSLTPPNIEKIRNIMLKEIDRTER